MAGQQRLRWRVLSGAGALVLSGCAGFFPPLTTTTTTTGTTTPAGGDFVYVANSTVGGSAQGTIAAFAVTTSTSGTGTLTNVTGSPFTLPFIPTAIAVTPGDTFLYVAGYGGIYAYAVNSSTGVLTTTNNGGVLAITTLPAVSLDVSPDGMWLFALSSDGLTLQEFQITPLTGVLSAFATSSYSGLSGTALSRQVRFSPNGNYVALALGTGGDIVYPFTTSTGALSASGQQVATAANSSDNALTFDANATFLYVARSGASSGVVAYSVGSSGSLSEVTGSPFAAGQGPYAVTLDAAGKYVYAANRTDGTISGYSIGSGGVLTALAGSPFASGIAATSLARDNSGKYVFAGANGGSADLTMYSFDASTLGGLDKAATSTTGTDATGVVAVVATH